MKIKFGKCSECNSEISEHICPDNIKPILALMREMAEALRELKSVVNIHSHITRSNFAWAEIEQADEALSKYEEMDGL